MTISRHVTAKTMHRGNLHLFVLRSRSGRLGLDRCCIHQYGVTLVYRSVALLLHVRMSDLRIQASFLQKILFSRWFSGNSVDFYQANRVTIWCVLDWCLLVSYLQCVYRIPTSFREFKSNQIVLHNIIWLKRARV